MRPRAASYIIWGALAAVLLFSVAVGALAPGGLPSPDDLGTVPDFTLTERSGRSVSRSELTGSYWVADFIFTHCTGSCPILTSRMASLARRLPRIRLVSFSVDPARDTLETLRRYAEAHQPAGTDPDHWLYLTGSPAQLHELITGGFHLSIAELPPGMKAPEGEWITHSDRLVLIDPQGRIRGYYHGTEEDAVERLARDLGRLRATDHP
ncbi:MAG: SCO family protein [Acidobacteriota bacterium]